MDWSLRILVGCLLLAGCSMPSHYETSTAEQSGAMPQVIPPAPSKSTAPSPKPKKHVDPDTRDQGLAQPPASGREEHETVLLSRAQNQPAVAPGPSARVTASDQSESDEAITTTARIREALIGDDVLSFRAKNVVIVTDQRQVVLQGRVTTRSEAERIRDIAGRMTDRPIDDRIVVGQDSR